VEEDRQAKRDGHGSRGEALSRWRRDKGGLPTVGTAPYPALEKHSEEQPA